MNPLEVLARSVAGPFVKRSTGMSLYDWQMFTLDGTPMLSTTMQPNKESAITGEFVSLVEGAYAGNGVVFACMLARMSLFSEARFQWQQMRNGQPGNLFGTADLRILEHPEPGKTTADLLMRAIVDLDLAGNWYGVRRGDRIKRLRPDWVTIIIGSPNKDMDTWDPDAEVVGYVYQPHGPWSNEKPSVFLRNEVAHFWMVPDPIAQYRGMSWLTPVLRELMADTSATAHKLAFFRNAATPNLSVTLPASMTVEKAQEWIAAFEQEHRGVMNAYRSMYFGGGAEATVIGANFQQMDFRSLQGGFETRIASAAGMHPVIVPFSEGLTGSSLNAGNFQQASRLVADKTLRPLWHKMAGSLESILPPPNSAARLWYDERNIGFLRADTKDAADTIQTQMSSVNSAITNGFEPVSAVDAITSGDLSRLIHTGLVSVQLQAPGANLLPGRAIEDFWPVDGQLAGVGMIRAGTEVLGDHPLMRTFPSMFETVPQLTMGMPGRCQKCNKHLADVAPPGWRTTCPRCGTENSTPLALTG